MLRLLWPLSYTRNRSALTQVLHLTVKNHTSREHPAKASLCAGKLLRQPSLGIHRVYSPEEHGESGLWLAQSSKPGQRW